MKKSIYFVLLLSLLSTLPAFSQSCGNLPSKIDSKKFYSEVISRGGMDLEFIFVKKNFYHSKMKIVGGHGYGQQNIPSCEEDALDSLQWLNRNVAINSTFDYDYHTAAYTLCIYNYKGDLVQKYTLCNEEMGD